MNISDLLTLTISVIAILTALISLILTIKKKKEIISIITIKNQFDLIEKILRAKPSYINVMGITLRNFLSNEHLLDFLISNAQCRLKVLVLDPESFSANQLHAQESQLGHNLQLRSTIAELKYNIEKFHLSNIEVRLYKEFPTSFMLVTDNLCAMQPYSNPIARKISMYDVSMLLFNSKSVEGRSIYNSLKINFEYLWERSKLFEDDNKY